MILIADSGSTKTSWGLIKSSGQSDFYSTNGINPFFRTSEDIETELREKLREIPHSKVEKIFFYGAGIINQEKGEIVKTALQKLFPQADVETASDLLAAARATLKNEKGIACILGTGSNSCMYNGENIAQNIRPLGFILGDEGSGAVLGRKLLADYLKGIMPASLSVRFAYQFPINYAGFMEAVYKKEKPNKFLAQLVPFLGENIADGYCSHLVENSFKEFIERNICQYADFSAQPVCFAGSVAWHFQEQLRKVSGLFNLQINKIVKEPLEGLIEYHSDFI